MLAWRGASLSKALSDMWLATGGVSGIALGVPTSFAGCPVLLVRG